MAQPSVRSFFNTRKRAAGDDISFINRKVMILDPNNAKSTKYDAVSELMPIKKILNEVKHIEAKETKPSINKRPKVVTKLKFDAVASNEKISDVIKKKKITNKKSDSEVPEKIQTNIVNFIKMGNLSPKKNLSPVKGQNRFISLESISNTERGMKTPTKPIINSVMEKFNADRQEMSLDDIKKKLKKSSRLNELKESLQRFKDMDNKLKNIPSTSSSASKTLKEFETIELEVVSPQKQFTSPRKLLPVTPQKNSLMSPRKLTPKKALFSPTKNLPAYQKYEHLTDSTQLPLPFKYRCLAEMFKCCESVCAMFHNRKETISFKKLKPAVQRMLRKNFTEDNLSQILYLYPEAYNFKQVKMRNYGSTSKQDSYQLVITPNVTETNNNNTKFDEDNIIQSAQNTIMNPQVIIARQQHLNKILLERTKDEHDIFLKTLNPPIIISKNNIKRWHPEFDLEKCSNIALGNLPQPPNVEKFSSAKDVLSTARNLFHCGTAMEKSLDRFATKIAEDKDGVTSILKESTPTVNENLLKGVPKSLLEKIRAKQAAKALDAMTRTPSQDKEAIKYSRLPELARYTRNVFVTEKKSVLPLEQVLEKIENSYRAVLPSDEIENLLRMIATEIPKWLSFLFIRKTQYIKISKDEDMKLVLKTLEEIARLKSKN